MSAFHEITPKEYAGNPFREIGDEWMLITAGTREKCNTMTASWGGMGVLWSKNVAYIFIRPTRYTKEFVDAQETLSLDFFGDEWHDTLSYLGKASGRDEDKIAKAGLHVAFDGETPYFDEAKRVLVCRKLYAQELDPACFADPTIDPRCYPKKDYHTMYVCEVLKILER